MYDLANLPGPGDFSPPDPTCYELPAEETEDGIAWCLEHDCAWDLCGGRDDEEWFDESF